VCRGSWEISHVHWIRKLQCATNKTSPFNSSFLSSILAFLFYLPWPHLTGFVHVSVAARVNCCTSRLSQFCVWSEIILQKRVRGLVIFFVLIVLFLSCPNIFILYIYLDGVRHLNSWIFELFRRVYWNTHKISPSPVLIRTDITTNFPIARTVYTMLLRSERARFTETSYVFIVRDI